MIPDEEPVPTVLVRSLSDFNNGCRIRQRSEQREVDGVTHGRRVVGPI